jgi:hypothetical protein
MSAGHRHSSRMLNDAGVQYAGWTELLVPLYTITSRHTYRPVQWSRFITKEIHQSYHGYINLRSWYSLNWKTNFLLFIEPEGSLPRSQEPTPVASWARWIQSTKWNPTFLRYNSILVSHMRLRFLSATVLFPLKFCTHFSSPPCVLHGTPIPSSWLISARDLPTYILG